LMVGRIFKNIKLKKRRINFK
jgi:hypothetical protein